MKCTIHKIIVYGQLITRRRIKTVARSKKESFQPKVMVWFGVRSKGVSPLEILDTESMNHEQYIKSVLLVALKYGN